MEVKNCRSCKRLFNYIGGQQICPACREGLEKQFQKVKTYLREFPNATMEMIAEDNEVSTKQLRQWVREERLTFSEDSPVGIDCEYCGKMIKTGQYCDECRVKVQSNLMQGLDKPKKEDPRKKVMKDKEQMRFLKN